MKTIISVIAITITTLGAQAQINFSATDLPPAMYGCGDWITIDSSTNEQAILIGGETSNGAPNAAVRLLGQDNNLNWIVKHNFYLESEEPRSAFFYEDNYVYIAIVTLFQELKIFRALMDGNANFSEVYSSLDIGYIRATITAIDINDDGYEDFLFSGFPYTGQAPDVGLIQNNGNGTFSSASPPSNIPQANGGYYKSGYFDASGRKHLVVIGDVDAVFENEGNGVFTQVFLLENTPRHVHVAITDLDNDGLNDISVTGPNDTDDSGVMLYKNLGNLNFQSYDTAYTGLPNTYYGETEYEDFNNDGYMDAVVLGKLLDNTVVTKIYFGSDDFKFFGDEFTLNDQSGNPINLSNGTVDLRDYNNDGMFDILLTGRTAITSEPESWLLTNTSTLSVNTFEENRFIIYPNPARDIISFKGIDAIKSINVFNQLGQKVLSAKNTQSLNVESLDAGMYLVQITDLKHVSIQKKIIKQ